MNELEDNLNDYINGSISFLTYRERRTNFINHFVDSGYLPDDTIPLNASEQQQIKDAVNQKIKKTEPLNVQNLTIDSGASPAVKKQYLSLVILISIAALTWYYSTKMPPPTSSTTTELKAHSTSTANNETKNASKNSRNTFDQAFVVNFLKMDQWNSDTLSDFLVKWQALSRIKKKQTKQSQSFIRLKNSLRLRILEQQALQSTKNKTAERQENLLIWFASQLSIAVS